MDKKVTYHEQTDVENTLRLRDVLKNLAAVLQRFLSCYRTTYHNENTHFLCL